MMSRIRDGNDVKPPRNLIGLAILACDEQVKADTRTPRALDPSVALLASDAIRNAHARLSAQRVEGTLLAEAGAEIAALINRFRKSKAEHDLETLSATLGLKGDALDNAIRQLVEVGFLEQLRAS